VLTTGKARAVVTLGDSITDGRGSTTNENNRWPNILARRLLENPGTEHIAVLNQGIGGNCVTRKCLGPSAMDRFNRDVLELSGVKWVVFLEGINDIGSEPTATAQALIDAFAEMADRARDKDITVIGGTIMPCERNSNYFTEELEAKRKEINDWIRTTDKLDEVIDFDEITRDPANPLRLSPTVDSGDGLHPSVAGHEAMADGIELSLFE
jgi:lysophospholipase L1-like esterase